MYENKFNTDLKQRIIRTVDESEEYKTEVLKILFTELKEVKLTENDGVSFCSCGYPVYYTRKGSDYWLAEIIKQEVDFRSYREFYYCPKCNRELAEFQH